MFQHIQQSFVTKHIALLLASSIFLMSFKSAEMESVTLQAGTGMTLETVTTLDSSEIFVGQIIDFRVKYDVKAEGMTVIPGGSIAQGQVVRAQSARGLGKPGSFEVQIRSVRAVDGQEIFLSGGNLFQEGEDRETEAIVLGIFVCILFLTKQGKDARLIAGYQVGASVASTVQIVV
jgi:hypothetical protein